MFMAVGIFLLNETKTSNLPRRCFDDLYIEVIELKIMPKIIFMLNAYVSSFSCCRLINLLQIFIRMSSYTELKLSFCCFFSLNFGLLIINKFDHSIKKNVVQKN